MAGGTLPRGVELIDTPPVWLAGCLILAWTQALALPLLDLGRAGDRVGTVVLVAAIALMAASLWQFARHRTSVIPRQTARALITGGVYRLSRNPIYLADALILTGCALRWDAAALVLVPLFVRLIERRFIQGEEAGLRQAFGVEFEAFAARTRRWL